MGNCTGYCTGCKEDYQPNKERNSYSHREGQNESFGGERYSQNNEFLIQNQGNSFNNANGSSSH